MKRLALTAMLLVVVLIGGPEPAPAMAQTGPQCLLDQATPPPPADGTVVLAAMTANTYARNPNGFDVLILPADGQIVGEDACNAAYVLRHPTVIAVGQGAAIQFWDFQHDLISNWGAVNVDDPSPVLFPGRPDFTAALVYVANPGEFLGRTGSCRGCVFSGSTINAAVSPDTTGVSFAYLYDLSGAQMDNTTWEVLEDGFPTGNPVQLPGWNLTNTNLSHAQGLEGANLSKANLSGAIMDPTNISQANLSGATLRTHLEHVIGLGTATLDGADLSGATLNGVDLSGAHLNHPTVSGTVFDGTNLAGSQLVGLQFQIPPSFNSVSVGQFNGACTAFQDSDLHDVSLTLAQATPGCASSPLFPGSTVSIGFIATLYGHPGLAEGSVANVNLTVAHFLADAGTRSSLAGLDLHGINLSGAAFVGWPVDLSGTKLDGAALQGTNFQLAELAGATFHNAQAAGAVFRGAHLAARGNQPAADFAGSQTNLQAADFIEADVSGVSFASANLSADATGTRTAFDRALAAGTDFTGVNAKRASFNGAHIYGNGRAFDQATDLGEVDFTDALLAGDVNQGGGFDFAGAPLSGAIFDGAQCIGCNFTGAHLDGASFVGAYLPGAVLSNATLSGTNLDNAWLYCGDLQNSACPTVPEVSRSSPAAASTPPGTTWAWALDLGFGEVYGPVPFDTADLTGVSLTDVAYCPDGNPPDQTANCAGDAILPTSGMTTPPIPCSTPAGQPDGRGAVALGACPARTTTLFDATAIGKPLAVVSASPPGWATALTGLGFYVGLDDGTVRLVGDGQAQIVAGQSGQRCASPTAQCGDSGPATSAQMGSPAGLAVGPDGALYVADPILHRVRRIDPGNHTITTVAGSGQACSQPDSACGDGGPATAAMLGGPDGVWIDPSGIIWIADDRRGLRKVGTDGTITSVGVTPGAYAVRGVIGDGSGHLYVTANDPDYLVMVTPPGSSPSVPVCQQLALAPGSLIQAAGNTEIDIVDRGCQRQHVPDLTTLALIEQRYNVAVTTVSETNWQSIPAGSAIPEASTDPVGFTQALWEIFRPVCARLVLAPGDLIRADGEQEVDIVDLTCQRRDVPDPATLNQITQTYNVGINPVPQSDWQEIAAGSAIPNATTDLAGFAQAMWAIFQPACLQLALVPGDLIQATGSPEIDIVDPSCQRRHVPDPATLNQITQTYNVGLNTLPETAWQAIPTGPAIPDASTDLPDFAQAMEQIFGSACLQLSLKSGDLIQVSGNPEIDIIGQTCQRQLVPNPDTLSQITQTYNVGVTQISEINWQRIPAGPDIPDYDTDTLGFQQMMQLIFGTSSTSQDTMQLTVRTTSTRQATAPPRRAAVQVAGQATPVVGTGTSGYNGTLDGLCNLLPGGQVQVDRPTGLAVRADGAVLFADSGNNLVRAYVPSSGFVVDLGGLIDTTDCPTQGSPTAGFNGDGQWADQTELAGSQGVTATGEGDWLFVVADTGNTRVRLLGPNPLDQSAAAAGPAPAAPTSTASPSPTGTQGATRTATAPPVTPTPTATPTPTVTATAAAGRSATTTPSPRPAAPPTSATPTPTPPATPIATATRPVVTPDSRPNQPATVPKRAGNEP